MSDEQLTRPREPRRTSLAGVASWLGVPAPEDEVELTGISLSSQRILPGDLYAALPGARAHGATYAVDAARSGAVAVLTDQAGAETSGESGLPVLVVADPRAVLGSLAARIYGDPADSLRLLAVTGTQGKTTVTRLAELALESAGIPAAVVGTVGTRIAGEDIKTALTTPEAPDLHGLFALMRERDVEACAMEVSSHALVMGRVDGVVFDVAVFTNLGRDHLDFHADMEDYFAAKAGLFTPERARRALVNVDDEFGRRLTGQSSIETLSYSSDGAEDDDHPALSEGSQGGEGGLDGVRLVGVVHDHDEVLALVDPLEPSRHAATPGDAVRDPGRLVARLRAGGHRDQCVAHVEAPGQGYAGRHRLSLRPDDGEARPRGRRLDVDRPPVRLLAGRGVGVHRDGGLVDEPAPVGVVDVDQPESGPLGREQAGLRGEVVLHVRMEVEVVTTEVGEHRDVEDDPVDPAHHQRVAGDLHRAGVHAALAHQCEERVQVGGLRGGQLRLHVDTGDAGADGADRRRRHARLLQAALHQPRGRRLALGPGHPDHPQRRGGLAVDPGSEAAEHRSRPLDHEQRDLRGPVGARFVCEDGHGAGLHGRGGIVDAVGATSGQRGVDVAGTYPLRAERDTRGRHGEVAAAAEPAGMLGEPRCEVGERGCGGVPGPGRLEGLVAQHPARLPLARTTTRPGGWRAWSRSAGPGSGAARSS